MFFFYLVHNITPKSDKRKLIIDLIERTFYKKEGKLACNDKKAFFTSKRISPLVLSESMGRIIVSLGQYLYKVWH